MSNSKKTPQKSRWRLLVLFVVVLIIMLQSIGVPVAAQTVGPPAKAAAVQQSLTAAERKTALTQLATVLADHYVLPEMAAQLSAALIHAETAGRFHHLQSKQQLVVKWGTGCAVWVKIAIWGWN